MSTVDLFYINLPQYQRDLEESLIVDPNKKKPGRPKKNKMYFTPITEHAIVAYNEEESDSKKNKIFNEYIYYPLFKLTENIINTFKFPYMDGTTQEIQHEVICFILQKLNKYSQGKGRAFSYFSIIAKNYLIQNNTKKYKERLIKTHLSGIDPNYIDSRYSDTIETDLDESFELLKEAFVDKFIEEYESQVENKFQSQRDINIAYSILDLFKSRVNIQNYNKKALYIMIREMTDTKTEYITNVVNVIKRDFNDYYDIFLSNLDD